jgi:hypothetical protein
MYEAVEFRADCRKLTALHRRPFHQPFTLMVQLRHAQS